MLRALILGLLVSAACGCSESGSSQSGTAEANAEVGKVVELSGTVTATRDGKARTLATGSPIAAADVIDTGKDGSIVIELFHNNARWSLESGIRTRVDESVAWAMSKQELAKQVGHSTTAAGRHGDREAAQTEVSGGSKTQPVPPSADPKPTTKPETGELPRTLKPAVGAGDKLAPRKECDEVACMMDSSLPCCSKYKKKGIAAPANSTAGDLPESPDRAAIQSSMTAIKARLGACAAKNTQAKGTVALAIRIAPDGTVASVEVKRSLDPAIDSCVVGVVKATTFAKSKSGQTFTYPIVISN